MESYVLLPPKKEPTAKEIFDNGCKLLEEKKYKEATDAFNQVIVFDKLFYNVYYMRGLAHMGMGKEMLFQARGDFEISAQANHSPSQSYLMIAEISAKLGHYEIALNNYPKAMYQEPVASRRKDNTLPLISRAKLYYQMGKEIDQNIFKSAIHDCTSIIEEYNRAYLPAYICRAESYLALNDYGNAVYNFYLAFQLNRGERELCQHYIYNILSRINNPDHLANIKTCYIFEAIIKLPVNQQKELSAECRKPGTPLYDRLTKGDGLLTQGINFLFQYNVFDKITKHMAYLNRQETNNDDENELIVINKNSNSVI